jgi:phosphatidylserine decarboxylase
MLAVNSEVYSSLIATLGVSIAIILLIRIFTRSWSLPLLIGLNLAVIGSAYMLYFFRDPERLTPEGPGLVVSGADGKVMGIKEVFEPKHLQTNAIRISIFLSLTDVHVNRAPIPGTVTYAQYFPGARYFTFLEKSSDFNQHSEIVFENEHTKILVNQIVGPIARRVVFWVKPGQRSQAGERIGMMKFGSRLDMYIPADDVSAIRVKTGQKVRAGETVVAVIKPRRPAAESSDLVELTVKSAQDAAQLAPENPPAKESAP